MALIERKNKYTWDDKVVVASKFQQLGNVRLVSELTGVPYQTILDWRKTEWWIDLLDELKQIKRSKAGTKLAEIIELGTDVVQDRLVNGDFILNNKTGEIARKPVSLRDAAQVVNNLITRQIQMEELAEKLVHRKESIKETLVLLQKEFAKFSREQQKKEAQTIEYVEVIDAVHDEREDRNHQVAHDHLAGEVNAIHDKWEEGLQEGSSEVHEQASGEEETGGTEFSTSADDPEGISQEG